MTGARVGGGGGSSSAVGRETQQSTETAVTIIAAQ